MEKTERNEMILIPHYTGDQTLEQALSNPKSLGLLWLEILLNGDFPWQQAPA